MEELKTTDRFESPLEYPKLSFTSPAAWVPAPTRSSCERNVSCGSLSEPVRDKSAISKPCTGLLGARSFGSELESDSNRNSSNSLGPPSTFSLPTNQHHT